MRETEMKGIGTMRSLQSQLEKAALEKRIADHRERSKVLLERMAEIREARAVRENVVWMNQHLPKRFENA
jgi:hypothetical protein